jgi:hypothetical protein
MAVGIDSGVMRHRVTVQRRTPPTNNGGVPVPSTPTVLYTRIPAEVTQGAAGEMARVFASQVIASATHLVKMRYRSLLIDDEIIWHTSAGDRTLRIAGQQGDTVNVELLLAATEIFS